MKFSAEEQNKINTFINYINKQKNIKKIDSEISKKWLEIAKDDLEITELLYTTKHYAASIYHTQQCYEKLSKSYFIISGYATPTQVHGHYYTTQNIEKIIKSEAFDSISGLASIINDKNLKVDLTPLEEYKKNDVILRKIPEDVVIKIIENLEKIEDHVTQEKFIQKITTDLNTRQKINSIKHLIFYITRFRISIPKVKEQMNYNEVKKSIKKIITALKLLLICLIVQVHYNNPRYPNTNENDTTYFSYNQDHGLVKTLPRIINETKKIIQDYNELFYNEIS